MLSLLRRTNVYRYNVTIIVHKSSFRRSDIPRTGSQPDWFIHRTGNPRIQLPGLRNPTDLAGLPLAIYVAYVAGSTRIGRVFPN